MAVSWAKRLNTKTSEPCTAEGTDCDESGLDSVIELGEAELCRVAGGVTPAGIVHRF
jgi:hypothetical protein